MPRKSDIANAANREWRRENNLVGVRLDVHQRRTLGAFVEQRWQEAKDNPLAPVASVDPGLKPTGERRPCTADIETIGTRSRTRTVLREVETGRNDRGPITTMKNVRENYIEISGLLTAEEADTLGTQEWCSQGDKSGTYTCVIDGRRFKLSQEDYVKLCELQS